MTMAQGSVGIYFQYRWVSSLEALVFEVGVPLRGWKVLLLYLAFLC